MKQFGVDGDCMEFTEKSREQKRLYLEEAAALRKQENARMRTRMRFTWNYQGHNDGFYSKGPNWVQFTFPASRKRWRCALIIWRTSALSNGE